MTEEDKKYEKVLNLLKKSGPIFTDAEAVTEKVIRQLQEEKSKIKLPGLINEYLFGWVYIGWIRRLMVAAALLIIFLFGYQQALILNRINDLSEQRIHDGVLLQTEATNELASRLLLYKLTGKKSSAADITVSEKEIDNLIRSVNKLQVKYKDLINLIGNDPQLKKYIEDKMTKNNKN